MTVKKRLGEAGGKTPHLRCVCGFAGFEHEWTVTIYGIFFDALTKAIQSTIRLVCPTCQKINALRVEKL